MSSEINHPVHYNEHPSGIECITIAQGFNFNLGNVIKYVWRAGLKDNKIKDLKKARFYLDQEINRLDKSRTIINNINILP